MQRFTTRTTSYFPDSSPMEGGFYDRRDKPLRTLQDYLEGKKGATYVSVAMDLDAFPYGTRLRIPAIEKFFGVPLIEFRVVDTGGAFNKTGRNLGRMDLCTRNLRTSLQAIVNDTHEVIAYEAGEPINDQNCNQ